jgi:two-component system sensor histidine kinase/response regulator
MHLKLLIIDDELGMRHAVKKAMKTFTVAAEGEQVGFEVFEAESGKQGIQKAVGEDPDIILLDYKLLDMTGLDVLYALKNHESHADVVMVTAFATIEMAVRATKNGAYDFLAKPFTPAELRATVQKTARHILVRKRAERLAEEKRRVRFEFIRVLGHELKAPLAAVESYLEIMDNRTAGDQLADYEKMIKRCITRTASMRKLIVDLLDMTRIEAGEKRRELGWVDIGQSALTALDNVKEQAEKRAITLESAIEGDVRLWADSSELDIVLNNLISNAVKYNRDKGSVRLALRGLEDRLELRVSDTGIGLTAEEAKKLFSEFSRIKNKDTRKIEGSGLGLSIVKKISELYGGQVGVESERGVGSTFSVTLPRQQSREPVFTVR